MSFLKCSPRWTTKLHHVSAVWRTMGLLTSLALGTVSSSLATQPPWGSREPRIVVGMGNSVLTSPPLGVLAHQEQTRAGTCTQGQLY